MQDDLDKALDDALEDNPRQEELESMIEALEHRRAMFSSDADNLPQKEKEETAKKLQTMDEQITVLRQELAITRFVEQEVRAAVLKIHLEEI